MADSITLTPEEQRKLRPLFEKYDLDGAQIVLGERVRPLLEQSGLPPATLGQIWQIVDTENRGFLDFAGFAKSMRLVAHVQHGQQLSPRLANVPAPAPDFTGNATPAGTASGVAGATPADARVSSPAAVPHPGSPPLSPTTAGGQFPALTALSTGASAQSASGEPHIPALTTADKKRFGALFDRSVESSNPDALIDGNAAKDIFLKARLTPDTLGKVWSLVDVESRGKLTKNEFVVAMHLIQSLINRTLTALPSTMPPSWTPWLGQGATSQVRSTSVQLGSPPPPPPPQAAGAVSPTSTGRGKVASLSIAPNERAQYNAIFDSLDPQRSGILGPSEAVPLLTRSGLSEDVLAKVWDLADTRSRGQLDRGDFALAMHLVKAKLNGQELPESVGPGAGASPVQSPQATAASLPSAAAATPASQRHAGPGAPPPPRQPTRTSTQQSTSSLNDLVSLDHAVFKPLEPAKKPEPQEERKDSTFVPTSSFGQQLLQKSRAVPSGQADANASPTTPAPGPEAPVSSQATTFPGAQSPRQPVSAVPQPPNLAQQNKEASELDQQLAAQKAEAARANEELASVLKEKEDLERRVKELRETYDAGAKKVHETKQEIQQAQEEVKALKKDLALRSSGLDAIRAQQTQESATLESLLKQKADLEQQRTAHEQEVANLNTEIERMRTEQGQHKETIGEHEKSMQSLAADAEASRWRRQELEAETLKHRERVAQAKAALEAQRKRTQEEAEAAAEAQRRAATERSNAEQAERDVSNGSAAAVHATQSKEANPVIQAESVEASAQPSGIHEASAVTFGGPSGPPALKRNDSIGTESAFTGSAVDSLAPPDTPRTSPPTSEANYGTLDSTGPAFTLPMQRINSTTSSVVNNPPQSIRGDLDVPSNQASPDLSPPPSGSAIQGSDSYEFVDARDGSDPNFSGRDRFFDSSDDEGPEAAIPHRYDTPSMSRETIQASKPDQKEAEILPPMPGSFPEPAAQVQPQANPPAAAPPASTDERDLEREREVSVPTIVPDARTSSPSVPVIPPSTDSGRGSATEGFPTQLQVGSGDGEEIDNRPAATSVAGGGQSNFQQPHPASNFVLGVPQSSGPRVPSPQATAVSHPSAGITSTHAPPVRAPGLGGDDFDEFDDLEEAREDDTDDFGQSLSNIGAGSTGPDEWQQLFASESSQGSQLGQPGSEVFRSGPVAPPQQQQANAAPAFTQSPFTFGPPPGQAPAATAPPAAELPREVTELTSMGFSIDEARTALELHGNNLSEATNYLLDRMQ